MAANAHATAYMSAYTAFLPLLLKVEDGTSGDKVTIPAQVWISFTELLAELSVRPYFDLRRRSLVPCRVARVVSEVSLKVLACTLYTNDASRSSIVTNN